MKLGQIIEKEVKGKLWDKVFTSIKNTGTVHISCKAKELNLPCQTKDCLVCDLYVINDRRK